MTDLGSNNNAALKCMLCGMIRCISLSFAQINPSVILPFQNQCHLAAYTQDHMRCSLHTAQLLIHASFLAESKRFLSSKSTDRNYQSRFGPSRKVGMITPKSSVSFWIAFKCPVLIGPLIPSPDAWLAV